MPKFTIDVSDACLAGLQKLTTRYNADSGAELAVQDWIIQHLKELSIQDELLQAAQDLQRKAEADANAALQARRDQLLAALDLSS